jgi:threonine synthase
MRFLSTAGAAPPATLREALLAGPAPDGGLYVPESLPPLSRESLERLRVLPFAASSFLVARHLIGDEVPEDRLQAICEAALDFDVPVVQVEDRVWALELFHGPTLAFKDVAARFMARLVAHFLPEGEPLTVLVATSGDTGSAVAHAFHGLPGIRVVVLFPRGRVSDLQRRQFTTLGGNVEAAAVEGTFDDCQRLVREAFADGRLSGRVRLISANSISVGRLLPQIFYYLHGLARLERAGDPPIVAVPCGNFGNLTAGVMAMRLGASVRRFVAATNVNDTVPRYLAGGGYVPRPAIATLSNAMDVGDPSNFRRLLHFYGGDRKALGEAISGRVATDVATRGAIGDVWRRRGYLLDPHGAVAYLGLREEMGAAGGAARGLFLATAHPGKFAPIVEEATGSRVRIPERLAACLGRAERIVDLPARIDALCGLLLPLTPSSPAL